MPIIPAATTTAVEDRDKTEVIPVDVTLAVANTAETLFTVPTGKVGRSFSLLNDSGAPSTAHVSFVAGGTATTANKGIARRERWDEEGLHLPEGTYSFIGGTGETPRVRGVVWTSDAPA
jgi:hypothetical protein